MSDLQKANFCAEVSDYLDKLDEWLEDNDIDVTKDEFYAEADDLLQQLRSLTNGE